MSESKFLKLVDSAIPIALEIPRPKKHVSMIVRKNEIVSIGTNHFRTHPQAKKHGYRFDEVHSELDALLRYKGLKDNLRLINFRFNRFGEMRISRPCCKCLPWCVALFDDIWYTSNEGLHKLDLEN
mgnify:FL=1